MSVRNRWLVWGLMAGMPLFVAAQEDAGRIEKRFEKPPEPRSTLQPLVFPIEEALPPEKAMEVRFVLKEVVFTGNTAFTSKELERLYAGLIGQDVTLLDIYRIRDAITAYYGNAGYGLSRAVIPPQRIQVEGIVRIEIVEGFVDEVIIEGATEKQKDYLAYAVERIKADRPLNIQTLERYLLLASDRFAIKVTSTMKQSKKTRGASTLILNVQKAQIFDGGVNVDNRGTSAVGPGQISVNIAANGVGGRASQTAFNYVTSQQSSELGYFALLHTDVISLEGTSLTMSWTESRSKPGTPSLRLLNNVSDSKTLALKVSHPFVRARQENFTAFASYENKEISGKSVGALTSEDKIRALRVGLNYDRADVFEGINQVLIEYSLGLKGFGATDDSSSIKSRSDGRVGFRKLTISLSRSQQLSYFSPRLGRFSINAALFGQYAGHGLLSSEECGIGGQRFGRAYDSSEILGDSCAAGSLELRFTMGASETPFKYVQFYGFYDGGTTTKHVPLSTGDSRTKSLSSSGLGVRIGIGNYLTSSIEGAKPLTRTIANEGSRDARIFASISARF